MNDVNLKGLRFAVAGLCELDAALKGGVRFTLRSHADDRVIYAFRVDSAVKYVGVCDSTGTSLSARMSRYQGLMGGSTNRRVVGLVKAALDDDHRVDILAWVPTAS